MTEPTFGDFVVRMIAAIALMVAVIALVYGGLGSVLGSPDQLPREVMIYIQITMMLWVIIAGYFVLRLCFPPIKL